MTWDHKQEKKTERNNNDNQLDDNVENDKKQMIVFM